MDAVIISLFEKSISGALLVIALWVFLPNLIASIKELKEEMRKTRESTSREHESLTLMVSHYDSRLMWHEAKCSNLLDSEEEKAKIAKESFDRAFRELQALQAQIKALHESKQ